MFRLQARPRADQPPRLQQPAAPRRPRPRLARPGRRASSASTSAATRTARRRSTTTRAARASSAPLADYVDGQRQLAEHARACATCRPSSELRPLLEAVTRATDRPVLVKIAPDLADEDVDAVADLAIETGIDGIIATNTTIARDGPRRARPTSGPAGLSGAPLKARALAVLAPAARASRRPARARRGRRHRGRRRRVGAHPGRRDARPALHRLRLRRPGDAAAHRRRTRRTRAREGFDRVQDAVARPLACRSCSVSSTGRRGDPGHPAERQRGSSAVAARARHATSRLSPVRFRMPGKGLQISHGRSITLHSSRPRLQLEGSLPPAPCRRARREV